MDFGDFQWGKRIVKQRNVECGIVNLQNSEKREAMRIEMGGAKGNTEFVTFAFPKRKENTTMINMCHKVCIPHFAL